MKSIPKEEMIKAIATWLGTGSINIFGMQFSGKDTQGKYLAEIFGGPLIGGGEILRNTVVPKHIQDALDNGLFIDSTDYIKIITPYLSKQEFANKPLILSTVGRWIGEETAILEATKLANHPIKAVVELKIDESTAFKRLEIADRGRNDDHYTNVKSRIEEFKTKTLPVLEVYKQMGLLISVDGTKTSEVVSEELIIQLYEKILV